MIGASPRLSLRETAILAAIVGAHAAARCALVGVAFGLAVAVQPLLIVLRCVGVDDPFEDDDRYGDGGVA